MGSAKLCTLHAPKSNTPFVTYVHGGTLKSPSEAPPVIVRFFKEHAKT